jgi:hypothetical protein
LHSATSPDDDGDGVSDVGVGDVGGVGSVGDVTRSTRARTIGLAAKHAEQQRHQGNSSKCLRQEKATGPT